MKHSREEIIERTKREFEQLDKLVANFKDDEWERLVPRPETKDAWTVKDALAHITHWKAHMLRSIQGERQPAEERGLNTTDGNRLIFVRWHNRPGKEVLDWHRKVQQELLSALRAAPEDWFTKREHTEQWPYDLDGHSAYHRVRDIAQAIKSTTRQSRAK